MIILLYTLFVYPFSYPSGGCVIRVFIVPAGRYSICLYVYMICSAPPFVVSTTPITNHKQQGQDGMTQRKRWMRSRAWRVGKKSESDGACMAPTTKKTKSICHSTSLAVKPTSFHSFIHFHFVVVRQVCGTTLHKNTLIIHHHAISPSPKQN